MKQAYTCAKRTSTKASAPISPPPEAPPPWSASSFDALGSTQSRSSNTNMHGPRRRARRHILAIDADAVANGAPIKSCTNTTAAIRHIECFRAKSFRKGLALSSQCNLPSDTKAIQQPHSRLGLHCILRQARVQMWIGHYPEYQFHCRQQDRKTRELQQFANTERP